MIRITQAIVATVLVTQIAVLAFAGGPNTRAQANEANALRLRLLHPANALYGIAMNRCSDSPEDCALLEEIARLCGATHAFALVPIDFRRYQGKSAFRRHVDRAFDRVQQNVDSVRLRRSKSGDWTPFEAQWQRFTQSFERLAFIWSKRNKHEKRVREIELECASTTTRPGQPVQLHVFVRYTDGTRRLVDTPDVAWMVSPFEHVSIDSKRRFTATKPGVYRLQAAYGELMSVGCVIRVIRARSRSNGPR